MSGEVRAVERSGGPGSGEEDRVAELLAGVFRELGVPARDLDRARPDQAADVLRRLTRGYRERPEVVVGDAFFDEAGRDPVVVRDIPFESVCQEHLLPFRGRAHVVYLPGGTVVGLSKVARLVDLFAHRLQTPSRLAAEVASGLARALDARGVAVHVEAREPCSGAGPTTHSKACVGDLRLPSWRGWLEEMA